MHLFLTWAVLVHLRLRAPRRRDDRGDVPGWVLITVMTRRNLTAWTAALVGDRYRILRLRRAGGVSREAQG